jgi:hypothetical protein
MYYTSHTRNLSVHLTIWFGKVLDWYRLYIGINRFVHQHIYSWKILGFKVLSCVTELHEQLSNSRPRRKTVKRKCAYLKHSLRSVNMNSLCKAEPQFRSVDSCKHSPDTNWWLCFVSTPIEIVFCEHFIHGEETKKAM